MNAKHRLLLLELWIPKLFLVTLATKDSQPEALFCSKHNVYEMKLELVAGKTCTLCFQLEFIT